MKLIKITLFVVAFLIGSNLSAQAPIEFGVKGGINLSNLTDDDDAKAKVGFNVGLTLDYGLTPNLYLLTGLEYTTKGCTADKVGGIKPSINLGYLQLPVHLGYKIDILEATKLTFHAGPYVAYGIAGKSTAKLDIDLPMGSVIEKKDDSFRDGAFKSLDYGVGLGAKVEFGKIGVGLGWDFGLVDINDFDGASVKTQNGYLTVGYKF